MKTIEVQYGGFKTTQAVNDELFNAIYEKGREDCLKEAHRFADQESYKEGFKRGIEKGRNDGIEDFCRWAYVHGIDFSFMGKITEDGKSDVPQRLKKIISDFNESEEQKNG